jgi:hypothetical protein
VSRARPGPGCVDLAFAGRYSVGPTGEVALEDYARTLTRAAAAEVLSEEGGQEIRGVHLCAPRLRPEGALAEDVEAFARVLAEQAGEGLGWS